MLAGGVFLLTGEPGDIKQEAAPQRDTRMAVVDSVCPADCEWSKEEGGLCYCLTESKEPLTDEAADVSALSEASAPRQDLYVCHGPKGFRTRTIKAGLAVDLKDNCKLVLSGQVAQDFDLANVETPKLAGLRAACAPCAPAPGSWGECPYCLHPDWHRTCAQACPVAAEER